VKQAVVTWRLGNRLGIGLKAQENQRVFRWPVAGPSGCKLTASLQQSGTETCVCVCARACMLLLFW
jgi:hypothetical protein